MPLMEASLFFSLGLALSAAVLCQLRPSLGKNWFFPLGMGFLITNLQLISFLNPPQGALASGSSLFYFDALSNFVSTLYSTVVFFVLWIMPKDKKTRELLPRIFSHLATAICFFHSNSLILLSLSWLLSLLFFFDFIIAKRFTLTLQILGISIFNYAIYFMGQTPWKLLTLDFNTVHTWALDPQKLHTASILLIVAGLIRQGFFPFHLGIKHFFRKNHFEALFFLLTSNIGLYAIVRYAVPLIHIAPSNLSAELTAWVALSLAYLSLTVLTAAGLGDLFFNLMGIQGSLVWIGFLQQESLGDFGALFQWGVASIAGAGFGLCIWLIQNRTSTDRFSDSTLCFDKLPRLAILFFVFGMAMVDFPGTLGFISEDLLIHSVLESSTVRGIIILVAMACASIGIYSAYLKLFLGRKLKPTELVIDLKFREAFGFFILLFFLVSLGVFPRPLFQNTKPSPSLSKIESPLPAE